MFAKSSTRFLLIAVCLAAVAALAAIADREVDTDPTTQPAAQADAQPTTQAAAPPADEPATEVPAAEEPAIEEPLPPTRIAHIRLSGRIHESPPGLSLFSSSQGRTLEDWLRRLARARSAQGISAVALEIDFPSMSWAQAQELADGVRRLGAVKPVYAYLVSANTTSYLVASAAGNVTMEPTGRLMLVGLNSRVMFFRGTLDWLGIEPQFVQIGDYKGAAEPMTSTEPSEELIGEMDQLLDDLYEQLCRQIATQRNLSVDAVAVAIDDGPFSASSAQQHRLIDRQLTRHNWREQVTAAASVDDRSVTWLADFGAEREPELDLSNPFALLGMLTSGSSEPAVHDPTIAIVHVDGLILLGGSGEGFFGQKIAGARTLTRVLEDCRTDERIRGVVLRVNSPGGSALASELIYQAVSRCAEAKPVIVSVSSVAASGGYYVAVGGPTILADPAAVIGSIGVVTGKLALTGLLDQLGISTYEASRGANAGLMAGRPWTEREIEVIRASAQEVYDTFVQRVQTSRGEKITDLDAVAQGRVFTASRAVDLGLIDGVGTLNDAVGQAREAAGITSSHYITLPRPRSLLDALTGVTGVSALAPQEMLLLQRLIAHQPGAAYILNLTELLAREPILTAMPMHITVR